MMSTCQTICNRAFTQRAARWWWRRRPALARIDPVGSRRFRDRAEAGARLADELAGCGESAPGGVVVGLPRGGVVVAAAVATRLGLPLDVVVVRKVGAPQQPELGIGAVAEGGVEVVARQRARDCGVDERALRPARRRRAGPCRRAGSALPRRSAAGALAGRDVIVVDDGFATGVTAQAALEAVRRERPARVVLAVPVAPADVAEIVGAAADAVVAVLTPSTFRAVGEFYDRFDQTTDAEVIALLRDPPAPPIRRSEEPDAPKRCIWLRRTIGGAAGGWQPAARDVPWHFHFDAGWSSPVARRAHNPKVAGSNPAPATNVRPGQRPFPRDRRGPPTFWTAGARTTLEQDVGDVIGGRNQFRKRFPLARSSSTPATTKWSLTDPFRRCQLTA